ncbi:hypothetical protein KP509_17G055900 [Ceratopteris richardii]|nr:hypothetical protein KP509_17G055900 [Ceratopteris richardii]
MRLVQKLLVWGCVYAVLSTFVASSLLVSDQNSTDEARNSTQLLPRRALQQYSFPGIPLLALLNPSLRAAFVALQAWKAAITSDPNGITASWFGFDVCKYKGVFCAPPPDKSCDLVVAGIDLNHAYIGGTLPEKLGLLNYLALFHINTNRFTGTLPNSISSWQLLYELDVSNNLFSGTFPIVALSLPNLAYLDVRFNNFNGGLPDELFTKTLDAIFVNDNQFMGNIPQTLGDSPASVVVFARNKFSGGIPDSISKMGLTLNEIIFLGNNLEGCIPPKVGELTQLTVFDVSFNMLSGELPSSIAAMLSLEELNVAYNLLSGAIPSDICALPHLENFTASFNFFSSEADNCPALPSRGVSFDDRQNCLPGRPQQRTSAECSAFFQSEQVCPVARPPPIYPPYGYMSSPPYTYPTNIPSHNYSPPSKENETTPYEEDPSPPGSYSAPSP